MPFQQGLKVRVRPGNDVTTDHLAESPGSFGTSLNGSLHRGHITVKTQGNQTSPDGLEGKQADIGCFGGHISSFDGSDQSPSFDESYGSLCHCDASIDAEMVLLSCVVFSVWQKGEKAGSLDGADDAGLLLPRRPRATGGFDFTGGRQKFRQHIEAFIVDFFKLELGYDLSAVALKSIDGDLLLFNVCTAVGQEWRKGQTFAPNGRRKEDRKIGAWLWDVNMHT